MHCPLLEVLIMVEDEDLDFVKKRQFLYKYLFYPQFQVLLITYDVYLQEEMFISGKIKGIRNILSDKNNNDPPI